MYILRADTGQAIEVNIPSGASIQILKEMIAAIAPIAPQDQILLLAGKRLDSNKTLEAYGLPSKDKEIFLFNRKAIVDPNYSAEDSIPSPILTQIPQMRPLSQEFVNKPLLHALKTYEHQFQNQHLIAQGIREAYERRLYVCKMSFSEVHVQARAIECAILNLNDHMGQMVHTHEDFIAHAKLQTMESDELLDSFDDDLATLKEVHLHPSLGAPGVTLSDCVPEDRLRVWANDGRKDNDHVKKKIPDLEQQVRVLQQEVDTEAKKMNSIDFHDLSNRLTHGEDVLRDINTKFQMFAKDYENVKNRAERSSQNMGSICDGLDEIAKVHEAHLSSLRAYDKASEDNFKVFAGCKASICRNVTTRIKSVSTFQSRIREYHNTMTLMGEALQRLKGAFAQLSIVKNMPHAYQAAVQEVARRRSFVKKLRREILRMNENIAKIRDEEVPKRDSFFSKYFYLVPKDLFPGLQEPLPILEVSIPAFDNNLPQIDSDLASGDDEDFTIVPFSDEIPKVPSFDKENAFNQSGSNNYFPNPNVNPPYYSNAVTSGPTSPANSHTNSNPIPIASTRGGMQSGTASLSGSPSNDVLKLQRDLSVARDVNTSYKERIRQLEEKLTVAFKDNKLDTNQLTSPRASPRSEEELRRALLAKDQKIKSLNIELDTFREKEQPSNAAEALNAKIFEQQKQIEHLMAALHTAPAQLLVSGRQDGETDRLRGELEQLRKREMELEEGREKKEGEWAAWRKEADEKYEGMMRQLNGELDSLRQDKVHTSRRWDNEKVELDKAQRAIDKLKLDGAREKEESEGAIEKLNQSIRQQTIKQEQEKEQMDMFARQAQEHERRSEEWTKERENMTQEINLEKQQYAKLVEEQERREAEYRSASITTQGTIDALQKEVETLRANIDTLRANVNEANQKLKQMNEAEKEAHKERDELQQSVLSLTSAITHKETTTQKVAQDLAGLQERLTQSQVAIVQEQDTKRMVQDEKDTAVRRMIDLSDMLERRDKELQTARDDLLRRDAALREVENSVREKEAMLQEKETTLRETTANVCELEASMREKDAALRESESTLREKDDVLHARDATLREKDAELSAQGELLNKKDIALQELAITLREKDQDLRKKNEAVREKDELLRAKDSAHGEEMTRSFADISQMIETKEKGFAEGVLDYERKMMEMDERHKQEETDRYRMFEIEREDLITAHNTKVEQLLQQINDLKNELEKQDSGPQLLILRNENTELKTTITELQTRLRELGTTHQQLLETSQKHEKRIADITEISSRIQKKNLNLEKRLQDVGEEKLRIMNEQADLLHSEEQNKKMRDAIVEFSENLKDNIACKNLQDQDEADDFFKFQVRVNAVIAHAHALEYEREDLSFKLVAESSQLRTMLQTKEERVTELERNLNDIQGRLEAIESSQSDKAPNSMISYSGFKTDDLVLFLPKNKFYEAFNVNCPNFYLSEDCAPSFADKTHILGHIIIIDSRKATAKDNPFRLAEGTDFHEVTITSV